MRFLPVIIVVVFMGFVSCTWDLPKIEPTMPCELEAKFELESGMCSLPCDLKIINRTSNPRDSLIWEISSRNFSTTLIFREADSLSNYLRNGVMEIGTYTIKLTAFCKDTVDIFEKELIIGPKNFNPLNSSAQIRTVIPTKIDSSIFITDCNSRALIKCLAADTILPFRIKGRSTGIKSNDPNLANGFLHIFLKPITQNGNWFLQGNSPAEIDSNGDWETNANYGTAKHPPKDGDIFKVKIVITDKNLHLDSITSVMTLDNLRDQYNIQELCNLEFEVEKPCYDPQAVNGKFTISNPFFVDCSVLPCRFDIEGTFLGLTDSTCDNTIFIHVLVNSTDPFTGLWYVQETPDIISDIRTGFWKVNAQYGDTTRYIPTRGDRFQVIGLASLYNHEITDLDSILIGDLPSVIHQFNASVTPEVELEVR